MLLFVYGSLRLGQRNPAAEMLHAGARHLGEGTVRARLYAVAWYPGLVPSADQPDIVYGDVFALDAESSDGVLAALDEYEGDGFVRREVEVAMRAGGSMPAETYVYVGSVTRLHRIASGDWLRERST